MTGSNALELLNKFAEEFGKAIPPEIASLLNSKFESLISEDDMDLIEEQFIFPNSKVLEEKFELDE